MTIDTSKYMIDLKGKQYLPVAPRIVMMRESTDGWRVVTEPVMFGDERLFKATIYDENGDIVATAHKTVVSFRGGDSEKAETGAIGRALSIAGFGTIQAGDMVEGEQIADSPQPKVTANGKPDAKPTAAQMKAFHAIGTKVYGDDWDATRSEWISELSKGKYSSSKDLNATQVAWMVKKMNEATS